MIVSKTKILFVQRVITGYRLDLLKELCHDFNEVGIITSKGDKAGTLKVAKFEHQSKQYNNLTIHQLPSIKIGYKGESRSTKFCLYPKARTGIKKYDFVVFEGTTNLINNFYLIPIAKIFAKKTIWWDAGYSLPNRSLKRKVIDIIVKPFVKSTDGQMAYSTLARDYLKNYMGGKNVFLNLNTINTSYFESISNEISDNVNKYKFNKNSIKLLYVGVVEERKKIKELIDIVIKLNKSKPENRFLLTIIGGGNQLEKLKLYQRDNKFIKLLGPIYDKNELKSFYFNCDLFVLPGDGGLAILQSLLYGLPVLSIRGADGTELDYIKKESLLVNSTEKIARALKELHFIDRKGIIENLPRIKHEDWKNVLKCFIKTL